MLLPGFAGGDWTLQHLAFWLRRTGYRPVTCRMLYNAGCAARELTRVERRIEALAEADARRVAIVGHSSGGHLARAAQRRPGCLTEDCACAFGAGYRAPFPDGVRLTSIYSKGDGIVRWSSCVVPYADNVEIGGSHVGLAWNRKAYRAIAVALGRPQI